MKEKGIIKSFIANKSVIYFTVIMIFIAGFYTYNRIPKQEYPDTTLPLCYIKVVYPGATPEEMEESVAKKLEERIIEIDDYYYSKSMIYNSMCLTLLVVDPALSEEDIKEKWDEVREFIEDAKAEFPDGVKSVILDTDTMEMTGALMALAGEGYTYEQLDYYGKMLKNKLLDIDGIEKIEIGGVQDRLVKIDVDIDRHSH